METRKNKNGIVVYRDKIYINAKAYKSPWFSRKTDAKEWKAKAVYDRKNDMSSGLSFNSDITLKEFSDKWVSEKVKVRNNRRTAEGYMSDLRKHILPLFGDTRLCKLSVVDGNQLISSLKAKGLADRTTNKVLTVFKTILNDCVRWNYIPKSPMYAFPELKEKPRPDVYWTETEINQFLRANINDINYPIYVVVLNTGLRLGEVLGLCWDRVNFASNQLEITRILTRIGLEETTKTHKKRIVPINPQARQVLEELLRKQKSPSFVFTRDDGRPIRYQKFSENHFEKAQKIAGMTKTIKFHDLRHTYASQFMMKGGNIFDLQKILGHSSIDMTKRYAHLSSEHLLEASKIVSFTGFSPKTAPELDFSDNVLRISAN